MVNDAPVKAYDRHSAKQEAVHARTKRMIMIVSYEHVLIGEVKFYCNNEIMIEQLGDGPMEIVDAIFEDYSVLDSVGNMIKFDQENFKSVHQTVRMNIEEIYKIRSIKKARIADEKTWTYEEEMDGD